MRPFRVSPEEAVPYANNPFVLLNKYKNGGGNNIPAT